jgi:hypothetical protein
MAGVRIWNFGLSIVFLVGASALAFGYPPSAGPVYIAPPVIYGPLVQWPCPCMPEPRIRYACPTPAPASPGPTMLSSHEPPLAHKAGKPGPMIVQNRTSGGVPQLIEPRRDLCRITFWNLSGFDVRLTVGDRAQNIGKDKAATFDLTRQFTWQTDLHNPKSEAVADDLNHFDVVIK